MGKEEQHFKLFHITFRSHVQKCETHRTHLANSFLP